MVGAADADGGGGRADRVGVLVVAADPAGQGAEAAPHQPPDALFAAVGLAGIAIDLDFQAGIGADGDNGVIHHGQLGIAPGAGDDGVPLVQPGSAHGALGFAAGTQNVDIALGKTDLAGIGPGRHRPQERRQGEQKRQDSHGAHLRNPGARRRSLRRAGTC